MAQIQHKIALAPHTTFGIGGAAEFFVDAKSEGDIREALLWAREQRVPIFVMGGGSNLLVPDEGVEALVMRVANQQWSVAGEEVTAEAGCILDSLIRATGLMKLGGLEKMAGIPGTLGGAIRGNAGAFGTEIKDAIITVRVLDINTLTIRDMPASECHFTYRNSMFKSHPELLILSAKLRLRQGDPRRIATDIDETIAERERRHIQNVRAAGSYFMNPVAKDDVRHLFEAEKGVSSREGRVPAGWLIEKAGGKGLRIGDAQSSEQHADYIVNQGHATAKDVRTLASSIKALVQEKFGIELKEEAVVL
jgi:UDP-N-acetylmuramate dehydrogenase